MGETKEQIAFHQMIDDASSVYQAIAKGADREVPADVLKNAKCIAVMPNVTTGALIIGGTHGTGLASCRDSANKWSQPAPVSLSQGSIGLQAGAKSTDLVLFFKTDEAVKALKREKFALGSDISVAAGNYGKNLETASAGVVAYSRTGGAFAGASISGSELARDKDAIEKYYGKNVDFNALLEGRESPDKSAYSERLTKLFPS
jgi:lipid-binding SYLF domain-containing protein